MDEEIMGPTDVMTRRQARKTNYELACNKLQEKWCFNEEENEIENKKVGFDCLDKDNTPYKELVRLAKQHHLNYKGTRKLTL